MANLDSAIFGGQGFDEIRWRFRCHCGRLRQYN